jgi:hypothetical protein
LARPGAGRGGDGGGSDWANGDGGGREMIDGLYFGCSIVAVGWLVVWAVRADRGASTGAWAPFDIKPPASPAKQSSDVRRWRARS